VKIRFLQRAYDDIDRLHAFLHPKNADAADRAVELIYGSALALRNAPNKGRPMRAKLRELIVPFGKGAYVIRYRVYDEEQKITVVRIWHSRERR
jgi:plasmid stabilization system protein ParE